MANKRYCEGTSNEALIPGKWHHVAVTFDGFLIKMYINGVMVGVTQYSVEVPVDQFPAELDQNSAWMGVCPTGIEGTKYGGQFSEFRLWEVVRTAAEILANYRLGVSDEPELLTHYKCDESAGATVLVNAGTSEIPASATGDAEVVVPTDKPNTMTSVVNSGGTTYQRYSAQTGDTIERPAKTSTPPKDRPQFKGYYTEPSGSGDKWDFDSDTVTDDTDLHEYWVAGPCLVAFDSRGGSAVASVRCNIGEVVTKPSDPTKVYNTFLGWYTGLDYLVIWDFATDLATEGLILYARWAAAQFTVTFDSKGGSAVASQTIDAGALVRRTVVPSKTGYNFIGWYKESGCTNVWDYMSDTIYANTTLYAKWFDVSLITEHIYSCGYHVGPAYQDKLSSADGVALTRVRDGKHHKVGSGLFGFGECCARAPNGNIYVAGVLYPDMLSVVSMYSVYCWDGVSWQRIGEQFNAVIRSLAFTASGELYVSGDFTTVGGVAVRKVAHWTSSAWEEVGNAGDVFKSIRNLFITAETVYVAGEVPLVRGAFSPQVFIAAKLSGTTWIPQGAVLPVTLTLPRNVVATKGGKVLVNRAYNNSGNLMLADNSTAAWETAAASAISPSLLVMPDNYAVLSKTNPTEDVAVDLISYDGTAEAVLATSISPYKLKYLNNGILFNVTYMGAIIKHTSSMEYEITTAQAGGIFSRDICYGAPVNAVSADPDEEVPFAPGEIIHKLISFDIITVTPDVDDDDAGDPPPDIDPEDPDYPDPDDPTPPPYNITKYVKIYFSINQLAPPPEVRGEYNATIYFDVLGAGESVESHQAEIIFDVMALSEIGDVPISFNVVETVQQDYMVSFYVNTEISTESIDAEAEEINGGGTITAGAKSVQVNVTRSDVLIATADAYLNVYADAAIKVKIYGIPDVGAGDLTVEVFVNGGALYAEDHAYSANLEVTVT
jgi:uncharacterized repeat protein (TIGR02543 family)